MFLRCTLALCFLPLATWAQAQTLTPTYSGAYSLTTLGSVPGVPGPYGGLNFLNNNTLLIGGDANNINGKLYQITVTRNASNQITGFSGTATVYKNAPNIDGGVVFGPGGVLFITTYSNNNLLQYKPGGGINPDKTIDLTPLSVASSVGSIQFVPTGFPGAGGCRILSYSSSNYYTATLTVDANGTYDVSGVTLVTNTGGGPEGVVFVPVGSPVFNPANRYAVISEYTAGQVAAYQLDAAGHPMPATRSIFVQGLTGAEGAVLDPLTNDFLFSTFGASDRVIRVSGFAAPPGAVTVTQSGGSTTVTEGGATDTYTVVLNSAPTANVTISINPGTQVTVAPSTLTFTPANWNVAQTVTVTAVDDSTVEGAHTGTITHSATSTDATYNGVAIVSVTVNITDNDTGPPPPPPQVAGPEGSFGGVPGPSGTEGSYAQAGGRNRRAAALLGPLALTGGPGREAIAPAGAAPSAADLIVLNVSHRPANGGNQATLESVLDADSSAWPVMAGLALILAAALFAVCKLP